MAKSKIFLFTYLLFGAFSLSNGQAVKLVGHYVGGVSYETKHDLSLFKDSSFQYILKEGLACDTILGNWNVLENKRIILSPKKTKNYHNESKCDTCAGKFYIKTYSLPDSYELNKPVVKVYNKGTIIEDGIINSLGNVIMQKADSIQINYFGFEPYTFTPQNKNGVIVNVFLIEEQQGVLQRDRILKIKKSKLVTEKGLELKKQF
ncbi:MAG: hypothetical protein ACM3O8_11855 [Methylococcaceae bacterium]